MARSKPLWQQSGDYSAKADRMLLAALWPYGGCAGGFVTASPNTMDVSIAAPGVAAVPCSFPQGLEVCSWDAVETVTLAAAPPSGQSRVDLIVVQVRDSDFDGGANDDFVFTSVAGVPAAANPVTPVLPNNAYGIASVLVPGAVANLNTATITDRRGLSLGRVQCRCRAYVQQGTGWNIGTAQIVVPFNAVSYDDMNVWDGVNKRFVCPVDGTYYVSAMGGSSSSVAGDYLNSTWRRNAKTMPGCGSPNMDVVPDTWGYAVPAQGVIHAKAGDFLDVVMAANRNSLPGQSGEQYCWATVTLLQVGALPTIRAASTFPQTADDTERAYIPETDPAYDPA